MKTNINEKVLLIRLTKNYIRHVTDEDLYNFTRAVWVIGPKRDLVDYAFTVFKGEIKKVYKIKYWLPVTKELFESLKFADPWEEKFRRRWMFVGNIDFEMSLKYCGKMVDDYFSKGNANPIFYVNIN